MLNPYRGTKRRPAGAPLLFGQSYYATSDLLLPKKITAQSNGECRHATGFWLLHRVHPTQYCTDLRVTSSVPFAGPCPWLGAAALGSEHHGIHRLFPMFNAHHG